jgi:putative CocE/NonD family hydrolase
VGENALKGSFFIYLPIEGNKLFTVALLPNGEETAPTVVMRSPYVREDGALSGEELLSLYWERYRPWTDRGYAVIFQHCRGCGKSTGEFVPYIYEREDGLALQAWVRDQFFYNGEIFLVGASYTASLHYSTHPFAKDLGNTYWLVLCALCLASCQIDKDVPVR